MNSIKVARNNLPALWLLLLGFNYYGLIVSGSPVSPAGFGTASPPNLRHAIPSFATEKHEVADPSVGASSNDSIDNSSYELSSSEPHIISGNTNEAEHQAEIRSLENKSGDAQFAPAKIYNEKNMQGSPQLNSPPKEFVNETWEPQINNSLSEAEKLKGGDQQNSVLSSGHATSENKIQNTLDFQNTSHLPSISNEDSRSEQLTKISSMNDNTKDKHPLDENNTTKEFRSTLTPTPKMPDIFHLHVKPEKDGSDRKAIEGPNELRKNKLTTEKSSPRGKGLIITMVESKNGKDTNNIEGRKQTIPGTLFEVAFGIAIIILGFYTIAKTWFIHSGRPKMLACCFCDWIYYGVTDAFLWIWNLLKSCGRWLCVRSPIAVSRPGFKGMRKTESTQDLADADAIADSYFSL